MQRVSFLLSILTFSLLSTLVQGQTRLPEKIFYGASYYPETWPKKNVEEDILRMQELNMNVVRMAEFSWSKMESSEGEFDLSWLKEIMDKLHEAGISVILGTPTATPPAWLWEKHPEIGQTNADGRRRYHGARKDYSYSSSIYRKYALRIVDVMARELGEHPALIGWQIDNELSSGADYSTETQYRWTNWLRFKYKSIENLNQIWATDLWSQTYSDFSQIPMPKAEVWHHPSLRLDWDRFNSDMVTEFMNEQVAQIRKHSKAPITHDTMPGQKTDYEKLMAETDFMAVNNYHSFEAYDRVISNYDRMRGYGKGMHWLFETAPNNSGGGKLGKTWFLHQPDGSMHAALWMNYALGGQGALFWLWRQHRAGQEMPHGAIIHTWGKPAANYEDLKKLGADLQKSSEFLLNAPVKKAECAIMYSHEADMGLRIEQYANELRYYTDWTYRFYLAFHDAYLHRDVIMPGADISQYKLLFLPLLPIINDDLRERLKAWVEEGGILLIGPMSGYRTEYWTGYMDHAMGAINEWSGIDVESRIPIGTKLRLAEIPLMLDFDKSMPQDPAEAFLWSEALSSSEGQSLASYRNGMHKGKKAIIENKVGKGKVVMLGTDPGREALQTLLKKYTLELGIEPVIQGETGVLAVPRHGKQEGLILDNITNSSKEISLPQGSFKNILDNKTYKGKLTLSPYQVLVLRKE